MEFSHTYTKIDLDAICSNYDHICQKAGKPVMAVVKADAYGHGAVMVAKALRSKCPFFGVSSVAEALELRQNGIETPLLLLGYTQPELFEPVVAYDIRPAIFSYADAKALSDQAVKQGKTAKVHLVVDTGMSRIGFQVDEESADTCKKIAALPNLEMEGLFSHFATADEEDLTKTRKQAERYETFVQMLKARGVAVKLCHLDNSAGIMNFGAHYDMVRAGIVLYGLYPSEEVDKSLLAIQPAMSWHCGVSCVKTLPAGRELSYGGTYVTDKETVVATVPAGYADGYRRCLSNRFYVLIHGQKAPILGRVCMDQFMVDVSQIPNVQPGDDVVLMGKSGEEEISAEAIAEASNSFNYEQVCDLSRRVERVYIQGGKEVERINYLLK